ncbi:hypothetical protein KIN20_003009 [Parelaphostrongylus tenuis]|uniref:Reverse transcriptase domain-containing protein n=1 Tax=Parelaphostrongylus tenuis TaxID=148309 RepID=A0AAD5LZG1_PARTN|nr:hypothetical protein KIN20_003009 [Parelaphostrongylus tenuis]
MESFDITALYTNVSNESAMQAIYELLTEHERTTNMYSFSIRQSNQYSDGQNRDSILLKISHHEMKCDSDKCIINSNKSCM